VVIIVVVGALMFYVIDKFTSDRRLANLLKILVVLISLAGILQRLLPVLEVLPNVEKYPDKGHRHDGHR
jgi:hypothetical protein